MAATIAVLGTSVFNTTAGNKTVTATPTAGDLIVVITAATGVATTLADNGTGGTYTQVNSTRTGFSTSGNLQMWVRDNLVASATSTIYTATQTSSTGGGLVILRVTGMSVAGAAAVRSSGGQSSGTTGTTPAPVLSSTPLSSNPVITTVANASAAATTMIPRTGYTEAFDNGYGTPSTGLEVAYRASGETSATLTQGGTSTGAFASIAIELNFNTAPTVALGTPLDTAVATSATPALTFTGTDADSDDVRYEVQVSTTSGFGISDPNSNWTADASAFDGSTAVGAGDTAPSTTSSNYLRGDGTTAPTSGASITQVRARIWATTGPFGTYNATIYTAGLAENLGFATVNNTTGGGAWGSYTTLIAPTAGWTWPTAGTLVTKIWGDAGGAVVQKVEIEVTAGAVTSYYFDAHVILLDKVSGTDSGFSGSPDNTDPFSSGQAVTYTVQAGDALADGTYYWRVRGKDPSGLNAYGAWATTRSFTVTTSSGTTVTPSIATLTLTTFSPTVAVSDNKQVIPSIATLTTATFSPTVTATANQVVTPPIANLSTTTFIPVITATDNKGVIPSIATLTTSLFAPTVAATANQVVVPAIATLTTASFAPTIAISDNKTITPAIATLTTTKFAPTVLATDHKVVTPGTATLVTANFSPSVTVGDAKEAVPGTTALTLTMYAPTVVASDLKLVIPNVASLIITKYAPTVTVSDHKVVIPGPASLATTSFIPTVFASNQKIVTPGLATLTLTTYTVSVSASTGITGGLGMRIGGVYAVKPVKVKVSGVYATKTLKYKISGAFVST